VAALTQYLEFRVLKPGQVGRLALRQIDAEPLTRDGVAVLEAGIAHVPFLHAGGLGQLLGDEGGVGAVLLDVQPDVFALTGGHCSGSSVTMKSSLRRFRVALAPLAG
jgi:hypothetical protein